MSAYNNQNSTANNPLALRFKAELDTVESILNLVQGWSAERRIDHDGRSRLRLVLEELLVNICFHGLSGALVDLRLEFKETAASEGLQSSSLVEINIKDAGPPFNPLKHKNAPGGKPQEAEPGGRGLILVRLLTAGGQYRRQDGLNVLCLNLPLKSPQTLTANQKFMAKEGKAAITSPSSNNLLKKNLDNKLALKQTLFLSLASLLLLWGATALYYFKATGDGPANAASPFGLLLAAFLGPFFIGFVTWLATSRPLRPLKKLARALEALEQGDLETPFPKFKRADEISAMANAFDQTRITLKASLQNLAESVAAKEKILAELAAARFIQESMLPKKFPRLPGLSIHASLDTANEVCGDLYDCFASENKMGEIYFVVGDVCGKGIPAAMLMSRIMSLARLALMDGLPPSMVLTKVNEALLRENNCSMFATMLAGVFYCQERKFIWSSAGHQPPITGPISPGQSASILPWSKDLALGIRSGQTYKQMSVILAPGQALLLYTDGADEAMRPDNGEIYGEERLAASFQAACLKNTDQPQAAQITALVKADLAAHLGDAGPRDDMTLMVLSLDSALQLKGAARQT